jgi:hypothetical protein
MLKATDNAGWALSFGPVSVTYTQNGTTQINSQFADNPAAIVGVLSHELFHVDYAPPSNINDDFSFTQYQQQQEVEEGTAAAMNIQAQEQILQATNGGINIGIEANTEQDAQAWTSLYNQAGGTANSQPGGVSFDKLAEGKNSNPVYMAIGVLFGAQTYGNTNYNAGWLQTWNNHVAASNSQKPTPPKLKIPGP